jgi:hypothetical protein
MRHATQPAAGAAVSERPGSVPASPTGAPGTVDFDLHGLAGIRLVDASPGDVAAVTRQLGPIRTPLEREPDIVLRFVEELRLSGPVRYVGLDDAGFTDDAFLVFRGSHKSRVRVQIPLEQVGGPCEIVCESGLASVPLLLPVLNLTVLAKGVVPLHASAFTYEGTGVLVTGWAKGGKTETLLAFTARGASYVGDEWVYVSPDGRRVYGIPEPIKLWDWHLTELPEIRARLGRGTRSRMRTLAGAQTLARTVRRAPAGRSRRFLGRVEHLLESQRYTHVEPERLFGRDRCDLTGPLDKVLLALSDERPEVRVEEIDSQEIARRMVFSLEHERLDLQAAYLKFRFAFPDASNPILEGAQARAHDLLASALRGKEAYALYHPFPAPIPPLYDAVAPLL